MVEKSKKRENGVFDPYISGTGSDLTRGLGPGTTIINRRRQSIKPQVAVKLICDRPPPITIGGAAAVNWST